MTNMTTIRSNGSRWLGQEPATVDELLEVLATETLDRTFEAYGNFVISEGGTTRFWGNFHTVSHVFDIETADPDLAARLTAAIQANQQTVAYLAQLVPKPLPRCCHCTWTESGDIVTDCGRH